MNSNDYPYYIKSPLIVDDYTVAYFLPFILYNEFTVNTQAD